MQGLEGGGWFLRDSGYPLKEWLMTLFLSLYNQQQEKFNEAHGKTRVDVEISFEVLKFRYRYIEHVYMYISFVNVWL